MKMNDILDRIDELIDSSDEALIRDTVRLVNIKSVKDEPKPSAPFGEGVKAVLDEFSEMADELGLFVKDYGCGVISAAKERGEPDLGIWLHGDVVPEGDGWHFPPYDATVYRGCIIGRGATDNKGQLAAVLQLFRIFKKLAIKLNYNPAIYLGSCEETGMEDIIGIEGVPEARGFINVAKPPRLSLVPDSSFPVGYGGKGGMSLTLRSKLPLKSLVLMAGEPEAPGLATAKFNTGAVLPTSLPHCDISKDRLTVTAYTPPRHGAHPDPCGNMITRISEALLDTGAVTESEAGIIEFLRDVSGDIYGETLGIKCKHEIMGSLTVFAHRIKCADGYCELSLNIRYPISISFEEIRERVDAASEARGFTLTEAKCGTPPYLLERDGEIVRLLCRATSDVTGEEAKPYTLSGATYANRLPNAYPFGMSGNLPPDDFESGRGGAHGVDEAVSIARLKRAMRIYARALIYLNEIDF